MLKPVKIFKTLQHVSISYEIILREFVISLLKLLSFNLLSCHGFTVVMRQHIYGISALCALLRGNTICMLPHYHSKSMTT